MNKQKKESSTLASFNRRQRTAIVCEVIETMLDVDSLGFGDALGGEDTLRTLAERFGVPFMALHMLIDGRIGAEDMREWCTFERRKAVA